MRVVIAHSRYRSTAPSGENRVVDQEAEALSALGHEVELFQRRSDDIEGWSAARKATLPASVVWNAGARRDLARLLAGKPDVVHVHNTFPLLSASILFACRDAGVPVVATLHNYKLACASGDFFRDGDVCHDCAQGLPAGALRYGCYRGSRAATAPVTLAIAANRRAWRTLVSAYACISVSQRTLLRGIGLPPERVFVRHNMIPVRPFSRVERRRPEVVYAGRLDAAKGLPLLMSGWDRYLALRGGKPGITLVVAGSGPLSADVSAWAAGRSSVRVAGQLDPDACAAAMAGARAVVLPSAWEETFGLAAVEAMALGTPPVAVAHGSFPELFTNQTEGVLFRAGDPEDLGKTLLDIEMNPGRYEEYGARARKTYERDFDPAESMRKLLALYDYAINNPVSRSISGR